jgi:hypothetical protein
LVLGLRLLYGRLLNLNDLLGGLLLDYYDLLILVLLLGHQR